MGCNIHFFDAGLMAGFLGAARGDFVRVAEKSAATTEESAADSPHGANQATLLHGPQRDC